MLNICKMLTGHTVDELGGSTSTAVHDALRAGIESGRLALVTFDGCVTHLVDAGTLDPESSSYSSYGADAVTNIEVVMAHGAQGMDVELCHRGETVVTVHEV